MGIVGILLASLLTCIGQLCQKQAAHPPAIGQRRYIVRWLALAMLAMGMGMLVWLWVLQQVAVNIAYPMLSLNFIWVTLAARWLWHEHISLRHWAGVLLIVTGVILMLPAGQ